MTSPIHFQIKSTFYVDEILLIRVTTNAPSVQTQTGEQERTEKDSESTGLHESFDFKCVPTTADQVRAGYHSPEYENSLRDIYFEVKLNMEADESLAVELFQAFGSLIAVKFKNRVFTRVGRI